MTYFIACKKLEPQSDALRTIEAQNLNKKKVAPRAQLLSEL